MLNVCQIVALKTAKYSFNLTFSRFCQFLPRPQVLCSAAEAFCAPQTRVSLLRVLENGNGLVAGAPPHSLKRKALGSEGQKVGFGHSDSALQVAVRCRGPPVLAPTALGAPWAVRSAHHWARARGSQAGTVSVSLDAELSLEVSGKGQAWTCRTLTCWGKTCIDERHHE